MRYAPVCLLVGMLCLASADVKVTSGPWDWTESQAGLQLSVAGDAFISRELLQLVDTSSGWNVVAVSRQAKPVVERLADGREGTRWSVDDRLSFSREVWVAEGKLRIAVSCEIAAPGDATDLFYSLEMPAQALQGGAWRATDADFLTGAKFPAQPGSGALADTFSKLEIISPERRVTFDGSAEGAAWSFQEWRRPPHDAYRLRVELPAEVGTIWRADWTVDVAEGAQDIEALIAEARKAALESVSLAHKEPLAARKLTVVSGAPSVGETCEVLADVGCTYDDPFDPSDVGVSALVRTPSRQYSLPAFYYVPHQRKQTYQSDTVEASEPQWRVRFLPTEPGPHTISVTVKDGTGEAQCPPLELAVVEARWNGLVRVSDDQPLSLRLDSGEPFYPMGVNIFDWTDLGKPLPPTRIDRSLQHIQRLAAAGGNFIRLRMDSWWYAIDNPSDRRSGYLGAGRFNQRACWDIDRLLEECERLGVKVMLCLENANATVNWPREAWRQRYNTYWSEIGGPCETRDDFWVDETARELFRRKIAYCVARWGASPSLAMWEFFNEEVIGGGSPVDPVIAWHEEMTREFKRLDPHERIVTTSPMGERDPEANARLWQIEGLDVAQVHDYSHTNTDGVYDTSQDGVLAYGKPFIVGEFGMRGDDVRSGRFKHEDDQEGLVAHLGRWASAMSLGAGTAMDWYISNYVDALNLWDDFANLRRFIDDLPRTDPGLKALEVGRISVAPGAPLNEPGDVTVAPRQQWVRVAENRFTVNEDGSVSPEDVLNGWLWGTVNHADLRNPPVFALDYPGPGSFTVHVMEVVGRGDNPVRILVDGEVALEENLVCEMGAGERSEVRQPGPEGNVAVWYDRDLTVAIPAGHHDVTVENLGKDRLSATFRLTGYATREQAPPVMVVGLVHSKGAHLWAHNRSWSPETILGLVKTVPAREVNFRLTGLRDGPCRLEWWDPMTGKMTRSETAVIAEGALDINIARLDADVACKIVYTTQ